MTTFKAACYDDKGVVTISEAARLDLENSKVQQEADLKAKDVLLTEKENDLKEAKEEEKMPTWAIAIIVVIGAVLLLVIAILGVVVSR